jgi:5,10-methenyltetrahydrofolate synthetase
MSSDPHPTERGALRQHLLAARRAWNATPAAQLASATVIAPLRELLDQLEPECLGVYWPLDGEFNPAPACEDLSLALPFAQKGTGAMHYRRWDGAEPAAKDDCGIPTSSGAPVVPDVVLVPCVGFTREGFRLGYGGGYFDRWLAAHPGVTTIGLAWSGSEAAFAVEPHDQALTLILTEAGLITPE